MSVNRQWVEASLNAGSFQSVVLSSLVPRDKWSGDRVRISCTHGDQQVYLTVGGHCCRLSVALAPKLPYAVVLGNDVPIFMDLVHQPVDSQTHTLNMTKTEVQS